jgi:hypothetical protein
MWTTENIQTHAQYCWLGHMFLFIYVSEYNIKQL